MSEKKPNIILITLDALRADHLSCMGYQKNKTPSIDAFAKESTMFKNAFSVGPVTPYSFPGILTSTYPLDYAGPNKMESPRVMISEVLQKEGYITAAFHSSPYLSDYFGYNKGWDFFEDIAFPSSDPPSKSNPVEKLARKLCALFLPSIFFRLAYAKYLSQKPKNIKVRANVVNQAVKDFVSFAKNQEKPFFLWVHFMDAHTPPLCYSENRACQFDELMGDYAGSAVWSYGNKFMLKNFIQKKFTHYLEKTVSSYDRAISYLDSQIGNLMDFLKKEDLFDNTVICMTADHGDEFLEHGSVGHNTQLYNEVLHVPLLLKTSRNGEVKIDQKVVEEKVSLIDLAPTFLNLAGIQKNPAFKGNALLPRSSFEGTIFHQVAFSKKENHLDVQDLKECKLACQTKKLKYILDFSTQKEELYDLENDPKEQHDISKSNTNELALMRRYVKEFEVKNPILQKI